MFLRCGIFFSTLEIVLLCHIDRRSMKENVASSSENSTVVNNDVTLRDNENSTIGGNNGSFDEINPLKLSLKQLDIPKDEWANREELKEKGRFLKKRQVVTCDGFVLTIFRLTGNVKPTKIPVLMMHGLYQSSDKFAKQSKDQSLAFKLQDLGYDVWLGNLRGNKYSRHHMYLDPEEQKEEFFNSTYEEMGIYDLAATVDFILNETNYDQLHYISHSVGGTVFLVLNSLEPWYNKKFEGAHLMAPIGYQKDFPLINRLRDEAKNGDVTYDSLIKRGIVEIFPYTIDSTEFSPDDCLGNHSRNTIVICQRLNIKDKMDLKTQDNGIDPTRGGSIKQLAHLAQNVKLKLFSRWDYGERENENRYGTKIPPEYILSHVTVPTEIIFAYEDEYVSPTDIIDMARDMGNATARAAGRSNFTHEDFITAPDIVEAVYDDIIKDMEMNSNERSKEDTIWPFGSSSTFCKRYFWPILIILIIIILILLGLIVWYLKNKEESGAYVPETYHKSTQTMASVPATRTPAAFLPVAPLPVEHLPASPGHLPVAPLAVEPLPAVHVPVAPVPVEPKHLTVAPLPVEPLPVAPVAVEPKHLSVEPLPAVHVPVEPNNLRVAPLPVKPLPAVAPVPVAPVPVEPKHLTVAPLPVEPLPVAPKPLPVAPLPVEPKHLPVATKHLPEEPKHLPVKRVPGCKFEHPCHLK